MANEHKHIKINGKNMESACRDYRCRNTLKYAEEPELLNNFTVDNDMIDRAYVPELDYQFGKMTIEEYRFFIKQVNDVQFEVEYYDYTLGKTVQRNMLMEENDIEQIYIVGGDIDSIIGLTVTFKSRRGYYTYEEL